MQSALVIDDQPDFLSEVKSILNPHFNVSTCRSPTRGIHRVVHEHPDLVIQTLVMREMDGFEVLRRLKSNDCRMPIVMISAFGDSSTPAEAMRLGAVDYITRPIVAGELVARLKRVMLRYQDEAYTPLESLQDGICTADPEMLSMLELAHIAANTDSRILILGETGTGKELVAHAIHRYSSRADQPFVEVNCAAIQPNLMESELFGHEKGAFTGALAARQGRFEQANGGTLFLDEIGEMSLEMQSKLLRVLQGGDYSRVGGNRTLRTTARIVAATNQSLRDLVDAGKFRADLFFRLNVVTLTLPPLRRRPRDIALLAGFFFDKFRQPGKPKQRFSEAAIQVMREYSWPGNVREMEHLVERFSILVSKPVIDVDDLPSNFLDPKPNESSNHANTIGRVMLPFREAKTAFEREYFSMVLKRANGNMALAARMANMDRSQFFRMSKKHLSND